MPVTQILSVVGRSAGGGGPTLPTALLVVNGSGVSYDTYSTAYPSYDVYHLPNGGDYNLLGFSSASTNYAFSPAISNNDIICVNIWFYPNNDNCVLLSENGGPAEMSGYYCDLLEIVGGKVRAGGWTGAVPDYVESTNSVIFGAWNHVYFYYSGTTIHLELNGTTTQKTNAGTRSPSGTGYFGVAAYSSTQFGTSLAVNRFDGVVAEVRLRTSIEPSTWSGYYPMFRAVPQMTLEASNYPGTGVAWADSSGNNHGATLYNTPAYTSGTPSYFTFDKNSLEYATASNLGDLSRWTIETWVRVQNNLSLNEATAVVTTVYDDPALGTQPHVINFALGTGNGAYGANLTAGFYTGSAWVTTTGFTPTQNVWYYVVCTYDGTTLRQYVNGSEQSTTAYTWTTTSNNGAVRIARRWDGPENALHYFPGDIGLVKIYSGHLTAGEVNAAYYASKATYGL